MRYSINEKTRQPEDVAPEHKKFVDRDGNVRMPRGATPVGEPLKAIDAPTSAPAHKK